MSKNLKTNNLTSFTFILITKNRFDIVNNINSFFNFSKVIDIRVIIIDGNKSDKIDRLIADNFEKNKKIKIIKQKKGKFVRACIIGVSNLETDFFTFAYDDDYISKDFYKLIECADKYNSTVIGNGIVIPKGSEYNFQSLKEPKKINSSDILKMYYNSKKINNKYLPASPACSVFKKDIIKEWKEEFKNIMREKIKFYYILHKNIGQDLLLYLISCKESNFIYYFNQYTAQFTSHQNSMSVKFGSSNLAVGYWLTKLHYINKTKKKFKKNEFFLIKLNLVMRGLKIVINQMLNRNSFTRHSTPKIIRILLKMVIKN
tara:strand:- start:706 stop:1653 length:948 start_codon:yes stop_codon:yes gene_type:complete